MSREILRIRNLSFARGAFRLGPISWSAEPGDLLWLQGPNGAGKSTLLGVVAGLLRPEQGEIHWEGSEWVASALPAWQRPCGILLQDLGLWPHLTIRAQSKLVAEGRAAPLQEFEELAAQLDVASLVDRRPGQLSGGEAQRCALLRTLIAEPPLLLLDEPYSAQHPRGIELIDAVLKSRCSQGAVVVVAGQRAPEGARRIELEDGAERV